MSNTTTFVKLDEDTFVIAIPNEIVNLLEISDGDIADLTISGNNQLVLHISTKHGQSNKKSKL